jgi:hypothetical protein
LRIRAYCEIVTDERCYHGRLQSESNLYPTGRRGAIGHRLILLSWFVQRDEERPGGGELPRNESVLKGVAGGEWFVRGASVAVGVEEEKPVSGVGRSIPLWSHQNEVRTIVQSAHLVSP